MSDIYFQREIFEIKERENYFKEESSSFFNGLVLYALKNRVSDIHIEYSDIDVRIRVRIDGVLFLYKKIDKNFGQKILTKIKILSELDIGEKRLPQDGRFKGKFLDEKIDFRVSFIPTLFGEKCVIRILKNNLEELDLDKLGFSLESKMRLKKALMKRNGFILICGPTGSGKTTTLYTLINELNSEELNIITIEDPIEYQLLGVNQVQCKNEIGLTFEKILRSVLRQDPDVILIGEIRDRETAEIALRASLTGHLVLSTLHTRDSISSIDRLLSFGIDAYTVASGVTLIQSQRLVRKICRFCFGKGCENCNNGFLGREVIEEILYLDDEIREKIIKGFSKVEIWNYLKEKGFKTLIENGKEKVKKGITTESEILKECDI